MGLDIDKEHFTPEDYARFSERLHESLDALKEVIARPGFGRGPRTVGAELEMFLVDAAGQPLPRNEDVLALSDDKALCAEIARYNLELNFEPVPFAPRPFSALAEQMRNALARTRETAAQVGGRIATIGTLPTLREADLHWEMLTDKPRYRALSRGAQRLKRSAFRIQIQGAEEAVDIECDDVSVEGANTSLQIHLRVAPEEFAAFYNAAQIVTGPTLAAAGNSPLLLGKQLWDETRIALFRQSVDDRPGGDPDEWRPARVSFGHGWMREGLWEVFAENVGLYPPILPVTGDERPLEVARRGGVPELRELRLHHGTIWRWNRPVYDHGDGGHLRIEFRAFPSGPSIDDMMANAAFALGLTFAIAPDIQTYLRRMSFGHARRNFYCAAREGLDANLLWPTDAPPSPEIYPARELLPRLLPMARKGLVDNGVAAEEADRYLDIVASRIASGHTGARWQRARLAHWERTLDREKALARMFQDYIALSGEDRPVHEWEWR